MALAKYLSRYAEAHTQQLADFPGSYDYVCVIPCFDESEAFLQINATAFNTASSLIIVVINQAPAEDINANNLAVQRYVETSFLRLWQSLDRVLTLYASGSGWHLLCVDAFSPGRQLPVNHGVGLARKIGADIACQLYYCGKIAKPWIFTTDADVELPDDYFIATANVAGAAALIFPYQHSHPDDPNQALAIDLYDYSLRYYVAGLHWAGSPYAFQTVGSTLAVHAEHYAKVRGFPKRSAGEDFYILNKLRKTGDIVTLPRPAISIAARVSHRTPFGTGAALSQIVQLEDAARDYVFYHPQIFSLLRLFLHSLPEIWQRLSDASAGNAAIQMTIYKVIENEKLVQVLQTLTVDAGIQHAFSHSKTLHGFLKHIHDWFDAFRALKLVHGLRDGYYPSVNIEELQRLAPEFLSQSSLARGVRDFSRESRRPTYKSWRRISASRSQTSVINLPACAPLTAR